MTPPVTNILGVDPGLTGALAFYFPDEPGIITARDMPVVDDQIDPTGIARCLRQIQPTVAIVESVGAMPGQGVSSMFKFGRGYGTVLGVIATLEIPVFHVSPGRWKKHFRLSADKEAARALAIQFWPKFAERFERKKDAGRAEAALIARFCAETLIDRRAAA